MSWNPARLRRDDAIEPIVGFRAWRLVLDRAGVRLAPTTPRPPWPAREAPAATCSGAHTRLYMVFDPSATPHRCPDEGCTCGWYAVADPARLVRPGGPADAIGQASLWGKVVAHPRGWRAEHAYPQRVRLVCRRCARTGRWPARAARVLRRGDQLVPACQAHARRDARGADETLDARAIEALVLDAYAIDLLPAEALPSPDRVDAVTRIRRALDPAAA